MQTLLSRVADVEDVTVDAAPEWEVRNFEIFRYHKQMFERTPERYDPRTFDRVRGTAGVKEIDYVRKREALKNGPPADALFDKVDIVVSPTVPVSAPLLSELEVMDSTALRAYEMKSLLRNTVPFSFLWWPSISVPCGFTSSAFPSACKSQDDRATTNEFFSLQWHMSRRPDGTSQSCRIQFLSLQIHASPRVVQSFRGAERR